MKKIIYLLLIAIPFINACSKKSVTPDSTGSTTVIANGKDVPANANDGVTFINNGTSVIFNLYAPNKTTVGVIGDFNNWTPTTMNESTDGTRWWVEIDNLNPNTEYSYQYLINGTLKVADPYSTKILDPANDQYIPATVYPSLKTYPSGQTGIVSDFMANDPAYTWKTTTFTRPTAKNLVVYELLVRDFVATHSYNTLVDTLNYIARLGVNAIEVLPVNEFEGNDSWGYNTNFMFALDKYYGTKNAYKAFIDACHARGIAVIQDIVLEDQFGSSPMVQMYADANGAPTAANPWLDPTTTHPDGVGYQLNHQRPATQYFFKNVVKYWMQEYHIDGLRFDQAKGYTETYSADEATWANYDASRIALWTNYNSYIHTLDPTFLVILEMFAANNEETVYANQGMMMWTDLSGAGEQATMGYPTNPSWDISGLFYDGYGFTAPYALMSYFESHDEERLQFKNEAYGNAANGYTVTNTATGLTRDEAAAVLMFSAPGPKMLWQFGELGYDISINQNGRTGDKPILWNYNTDVNRKHLYNIYAKMIHWKLNNAVFTSTNFKYSLSGAIKSIQMLDASNNIVTIGNFDVVSSTASISFPAVGSYYDNITGTTLNVTSVPYSMTLAPGEYHLYSTTALK